MKHLEERLKTIADKRNEKQQIETHLALIKSRLNAHQLELKSFKKELEELDEKLNIEEPSNLIKLFNKILGSQDDMHYERERQTFLLTHLNHQNCLDRIKTIEFEIGILDDKLASYQGVEEQYQKLLSEKKSQLKFRHKDLATEIILLESAIRSHKYQQKQIVEAYDVGKELIALLTKLYDELVELTDISIWQPNEMRNNQTGVIVTMQKRKQAKSLQQSLQIISRLCDKYSDELNDVSDRFNMDYTPFTSTISTFLEYFYDGFISDYIRRKQLKICLSHIDTTLEKVYRINEMLQGDLKTSERQLGINEGKLEEVVLGSGIY